MGGMSAKYKKRDKVTRINNLRLQMARVKENQQKTEEAVDKDTEKAKQLLREGNREEAKKVLMRKRNRERQLRSSNAQLDKIEQLTEDLELMTELAKLGEDKGKRRKWKWFSKKHKKRRQNTGLQARTEGQNNQVVEIQVLDGSKKKEKEKILAEMRHGVEKQRKIDDVFSQRLGGSHWSNEVIDKAVEDELEAILHADYQLPNTEDEAFEKDITVVAVGGS